MLHYSSKYTEVVYTMKFMHDAIQQAQQALIKNEIPVGAVVVNNNKILSASCNLVENTIDPTAHAEIVVIRQACKLLHTTKLINCELYVTLEPCAMCAQAIASARIKRLYFGTYDRKSGGVEHGSKVFSHSTCHHVPEIYGGIMEQDCKALLTNFFSDKRNK